MEIAIDPARLLLVGLLHDDGSLHEFVAAVCRFVVFRPPGIPEGPAKVAVEIVFDPLEQQPAHPYYCDRARLVRRVAAPDRVKQVRPYLPV
jgi:hypothetical protein